MFLICCRCIVGVPRKTCNLIISFLALGSRGCPEGGLVSQGFAGFYLWSSELTFALFVKLRIDICSICGALVISFGSIVRTMA